MDEKDIDHTQQFTSRSIKVSINNEDGFPLQQVQLNIKPRLLLCDQIFRYYEAENTRSVSSIPNFLKHMGVGELHPLNLCKVKCSNSDIVLDIASETSLSASVHNSESGTV